MIKSLELENFKAFGERIHIPFAPITLFFGKNSAGKSSILQSLYLLKQTIEFGADDRLLLTRTENGIVDLGDFKELLFDHNTEKALSMLIEAPVEPPESLQWTEDDSCFGYYGIRDIFSSENIKVGLTFKFSGKKKKAVLGKFQVFVPEQEECLVELQQQMGSQYAKIISITQKKENWQDNFYQFKQNLKDFKKREKKDDHLKGHYSTEDLKRIKLNKSLIKKTLKEYGCYKKTFVIDEYIAMMKSLELQRELACEQFIPKGIPFWKKKDLATNGLMQFDDVYGGDRNKLNLGAIAVYAGEVLNQTLRMYFPFSPFRKSPERWYPKTGRTVRDVGHKGDTLPALLYNMDKAKFDKANEWLGKDNLDIGYRLVPSRKKFLSSDRFEIRLADTYRKKVDVSLSDVGFGISQLLPFVVEALVSEGKIISIEQPETHIHPKLQADIGDLLAECIKEPRKNQFLIETHSEHLVLRLQKLVRQKTINSSDVSIIYVSRGENGSTIHHLKIDDNGYFIDEWPDGFFPERLRELR